jgi:mannosyl-3-phosphoglycerate phosphatase
MREQAFPVVFSDLDGTLLDHDTYSFEPAAEAIGLLTRRGIPIVICSSKTRAEIEAVQWAMGLDHPFVSENGGGFFVPRGYFPFPIGERRRDRRHRAFEFGQRYPLVVAALRVRARAAGAGVVGFADLSAEQVASVCGLTVAQAKLAKRRDYDEPFAVVDGGAAARRALFGGLRAAGLTCTSGTRFDHVTGAAGKGGAIRVARALYARATGRRVLAIGLGDGPNDLSMFREVDLPVLVGARSTPNLARLLRGNPVARLIERRGPEGWADAIHGVVRDLDGGHAGAERRGAGA